MREATSDFDWGRRGSDWDLESWKIGVASGFAKIGRCDDV